MGERWNLLELHSHKVLCVLPLICLLTNECLSINLEGAALFEFRSRVESDPYRALNNWDASDSNTCNWNGVGCIDGKVVMMNLKEFALNFGIRHCEAQSLASSVSHILVLYLPQHISEIWEVEDSFGAQGRTSEVFSGCFGLLGIGGLAIRRTMCIWKRKRKRALADKDRRDAKL